MQRITATVCRIVLATIRDSHKLEDSCLIPCETCVRAGQSEKRLQAAFLRRVGSVDFSPNAAGRIGRKVAASLSFRVFSCS